MNLHGARDGAHGARSHAVFARRFERGFAQFGVSRKAKIIIRGQVDDPLAVKGAERSLLVIQHTQLEMRALGSEFVELIGQK